MTWTGALRVPAELLKAGATGFEGEGAVRSSSSMREEVKEDDGCGDGFAEHFDAAGGGVDAQGELVEVQAGGAGDDDFAIEDATRGEVAV